MKKIPNATFEYSDDDRTIHYKNEDGVAVSDTAPEGKVFRFYFHDSKNIFYYEVDHV